MGPLIDSAAVARVDRIVEDSASYGTGHRPRRTRQRWVG